MEKIRFFIERFGRKPHLVLLVSVLVATAPIERLWAAAASQTEKAEKQKVLRQVSQEWYQVGMEQYRRGFYTAAAQSLLEAQMYQEYLTAGEREKLQHALEKAQIAVSQRKQISEAIQRVYDLVNQGDLTRAIAYLERVKDSEFLSERERALVTERLKNIESQLNEQKKAFTELYKRSVKLYNSGEFEKAREGFLKIAKSNLAVGPDGKRAKDYLARIDNILMRRGKLPTRTEVKPVEKKHVPARQAVAEELPDIESEALQRAKPEVVEKPKKPAVVQAQVRVSKPGTRQVSYIGKIDRRRNILRSYTRAVVNDAVAKARSYISEGEFGEATKAVERAEWTVYQNWVYLGDELFKQYNRKLKQLTEKIIEEQNKKARQ